MACSDSKNNPVYSSFEDYMWRGKCGLCLLILFVTMGLGFAWFGWVGRPLNLFQWNAYVISRSGFESQIQVPKTLWYVSWIVSVMTLMAIPSTAVVIAVCSMCYKRACKPVVGKSYKWYALPAALLGGVLGMIGTMLS